jgi:hypothetical protein
MAPGQKFVLWLEEGDSAIFDLPEPGDDVSSAEEISLVTSYVRRFNNMYVCM